MDGPQVIIKLIPRSSRGSSCRNMFCLSFYHARSSLSRSALRRLAADISAPSPPVAPSISRIASHSFAHRERAFRTVVALSLSFSPQPNIFIRPLGGQRNVRLLKRFHPEEIRFTPRCSFYCSKRAGARQKKREAEREKRETRAGRRGRGASKHVHGRC